MEKKHGNKIIEQKNVVNMKTAFTRRFRELLSVQKKTVEILCDEVSDISRTSLYNYYSGKTLPKFSYAKLIADKLNTSVEYLYGFIEESTNQGVKEKIEIEKIQGIINAIIKEFGYANRFHAKIEKLSHDDTDNRTKFLTKSFLQALPTFNKPLVRNSTSAHNKEKNLILSCSYYMKDFNIYPSYNINNMYGNEYSYQKDDVYFIFEGCIYPLAFCDGEFPLTPKTIKKSIYNIFNDDEIYINTQGDKHTPLRREEGYKKLRKEYNKARYSLGRIGILNAESFYLLNYVLGAFEID